MSAEKFIYGVIQSPKISNASRNRLEEIQFYSAYAEPGYDDPASGIIALGDWNDANERNPEYEDDKRQSPWRKADSYVSRVARVLEERYGVELEWCDEWCSCSDCNKLVRTNPDSYCWTRAYVEQDGDIVCHECAAKDAPHILDSFENKPKKAITADLGIDPGAHGYKCILKDLENGFHEGQAADPSVIAAELRKLGVNRFLFSIDSTGQFGIKLSCWVHEEEIEMVPREACENCGGSGSIEYYKGSSHECHACSGLGKLPRFNTDAAVSPAEQMKAALRQVPVSGGKPGEIAYSSIEGSAVKTTVMTHEQIRNCPSLIMLPSHYWPDGVCKCVRKEEK